MVMRPLRFKGAKLVINYSTSAAGSVRVELQNAGGRALSGFELDQSVEIYGDQIERVVSWKQGSNVSRLAATPIRLRFSLKDADLYSIRFSP